MNRQHLLLIVIVVFFWGSAYRVDAQRSKVSLDYDLGGPCRENSEAKGVNIAGELAKVREQKNWSRAVALQKRSVRGMCDNAHRWMELVKYLQRANRDTEPLQVLTELYRDAPNWFEEVIRRETYSFLDDIIASDTYRNSTLRTLRKQHLDKLASRRRRFRKQLSKLSENQQPPKNYVAKEACPFECCVYRTWSVQDTVALYEKPRGETVIGNVSKGDTVEGLTGNVYLRPEPARVLHKRKVRPSEPISTLQKGDVLFVLDYTGEGYSHVWYRNKTLHINTMRIKSYCPEATKDCWGEYLYPKRARKDDDWWVKVRTSGGILGWTDETDSFGNMDQCAYSPQGPPEE